MKTFFSLIVPFIIALLTPMLALAYLDDHGPFERENLPKPFPVNECYLLEGTNTAEAQFKATSLTFTTTNSAAFPRVKVERQPEPSQTVLSVSAAAGRLLLAPTKVSDLNFYVEALTADFNRDGTADYAVLVWSGGCGLACGCCDVAFVLSNGHGFRTQTIRTWFPKGRDFIDLKGDGYCQFMHTSFVYGEEPGRDGKIHNYWVYNLFSFDGPNLKYANNMIDGFPKWVWFTHAPNHKPTTQLTNDQKRRLWKRHADILGDQEQKPCNSEGQSSKKAKDWQNLKYSFTRKEYVHPRIIEELKGWISDPDGAITSVDLLAGNDSNRFFGDFNVREADGQTWVEYDRKAGHGFFSYRYIGTSPSGIHILLCADSGGGSGVFENLMLLSLHEDVAIDGRVDSVTKRKRVILSTVGSIALGDRYSGDIVYTNGVLKIGADQSLMKHGERLAAQEIPIE